MADTKQPTLDEIATQLTDLKAGRYIQVHKKVFDAPFDNLIKAVNDAKNPDGSLNKAKAAAIDDNFKTLTDLLVSRGQNEDKKFPGNAVAIKSIGKVQDSFHTLQAGAGQAPAKPQAPVTPQTPQTPTNQTPANQTPVSPKTITPSAQGDDQNIVITREQASEVKSAMVRAEAKLDGISDYMMYTRGGKIFDGLLEGAQTESTKVLKENTDGSFTFNKDAYTRMVINFAAVKGSAREIELQSLEANELTPKQRAILDSVKTKMQAHPSATNHKKLGGGNKKPAQPKQVIGSPELLGAGEELFLPKTMVTPSVEFSRAALNELTSESTFGFLGQDKVNEGEIIAGTMHGAVKTIGVYAPETAVAGLEKVEIDHLHAPETPRGGRGGKGAKNQKAPNNVNNVKATGFHGIIVDADNAANRVLDNNGFADPVDKKYLTDRLRDVITFVDGHMAGLAKDPELQKLEKHRAEGIDTEIRELIGQAGNLKPTPLPPSPGETEGRKK